MRPQRANQQVFAERLREGVGVGVAKVRDSVPGFLSRSRGCDGPHTTTATNITTITVGVCIRRGVLSAAVQAFRVSTTEVGKLFGEGTRRRPRVAAVYERGGNVDQRPAVVVEAGMGIVWPKREKKETKIGTVCC